MTQFDPYRVLGIHPSADEVVVRAAYRALAQKYHPDKFDGAPDEATRRMIEINRARDEILNLHAKAPPSTGQSQSAATHTDEPPTGAATADGFSNPGSVPGYGDRRRAFVSQDFWNSITDDFAKDLVERAMAESHAASSKKADGTTTVDLQACPTYRIMAQVHDHPLVSKWMRLHRESRAA